MDDATATAAVYIDATATATAYYKRAAQHACYDAHNQHSAVYEHLGNQHAQHHHAVQCAQQRGGNPRHQVDDRGIAASAPGEHRKSDCVGSGLRARHDRPRSAAHLGRQETEAPHALMTAPPSFTCPKCGWTSYNTNDVRFGYCGHCHRFTGDDARYRYGDVSGDRLIEGMFFDPDGKPLSTLQWAIMYEDRFKDLSAKWWRIGRDFLDTEDPAWRVEVSTLWDGMAMARPEDALHSGPPRVFESMVFLQNDQRRERIPIDTFRDRYTTRDAARAGHEEILDAISRITSHRRAWLLRTIHDHEAEDAATPADDE